MNKGIILGLALILLMPIVFAQSQANPPFQTSDGITELTIIYPKDDYFLYNSSFHFHVHAVNSTGFPLNNSDYSCAGHFYSTQNEHMLEIQSLPDSNDFDEYFVINQTLTREIGTHPYNIWCASGSQQQGIEENGYVSAYFFITESSEFEMPSPILAIVVILLPILFAIILLFGATLIKDEEHIVLKIFLFLTSIPMYFVSSNIASSYVDRYETFTEMVQLIAKTTNIVGWIFWLIIAYFAIYLILKLFESIRRKKAERLNY